MVRIPSGVSPHFLLVSACVFWGAATVLNKALLGAVPPILLLTLQLAPAAALLCLAAWLRGARWPRGRGLWAAAALGLLNPGISYSLSMLGLARIDASVAGLMWATEPLMILLLAGLVLREPVGLRLAGIIALGFLGAVLIGGTPAGRPDLAGLGLQAGAVFLCAVYTVGSRWLSQDHDPLAVVAVQQTSGLFWALALLAATGMSFTPAGGPVLLAALAGGVLYYGLSYWLYVAALRRVTAANAGAYFNLIPLVTLALAFLFLGERLSAGQWAGASLVGLAALLLLKYPQSEAAS